MPAKCCLSQLQKEFFWSWDLGSVWDRELCKVWQSCCLLLALLHQPKSRNFKYETILSSFPVLAAVGLWKLKWKNPKIWQEKTQQPSEHLVGLGLIFPQLKTPRGKNEEIGHGQMKGKKMDQPKLRVYVPVSHHRYVAGECPSPQHSSSTSYKHHRCKYSPVNPTGIFCFSCTLVFQQCQEEHFCVSTGRNGMGPG